MTVEMQGLGICKEKNQVTCPICPILDKMCPILVIIEQYEYISAYSPNIYHILYIKMIVWMQG